VLQTGTNQQEPTFEAVRAKRRQLPGKQIPEK
jgi:hypothetical protein